MRLKRFSILLTVLFFSCGKEKILLNQSKDLGYSTSQGLTELSGLIVPALDVAFKFENTRYSQLVLSLGVSVRFIDSLFTDGDGLVFEINFGSLGSEKPNGKLCLDGKYRAGILACKLDTFISAGIAKVEIAPKGNFYIGNGFEMFQLTGNGVLGFSKNNKAVFISSFNIQRVNAESFELATDLTIDFKDLEMVYTGKGTGTSMSNHFFGFQISEDLIKLNNCGNTFTKGKISISKNNDAAITVLDFDPYQNQECDTRVRTKLKQVEEIFYLY